ncbi:MAG TPA: RagB/SusD family nutrient uptake outer membrane protein, partial [Mariniphaga sp.]|nr:RagB/SusD family nutrient uptake outer membrane protein [Mariniphaga sp.]
NGKWVFKDNLPLDLNSSDDTTRNWFPVIAKCSTSGKHPQELYLANQTVPGSLTNSAQLTYRDQYVIRLAETYLLRAEAYLGNNDRTNAAIDINMVRNRSKAPEIDASMVDIDYILDERIRELHFEELYLLTLTRLGKLVERAQLNPWVGETYLPHNDLWPIPYDDIEKNLEAQLEQNPGY